jgi:hypothetical protein
VAFNFAGVEDDFYYGFLNADRKNSTVGVGLVPTRVFDRGRTHGFAPTAYVLGSRAYKRAFCLLFFERQLNQTAD